MEESEVIDLTEEFVSGRVSLARWTHAAHVATAAYLVRTEGRRRALDVMRRGIQSLNRVHGSSGYHETLTVAWVDLLAGIDREHAGESTGAMLRHVIDACADKTRILAHYTRERIMSDEARARFVPPDLAPLPAVSYAHRDGTLDDATRINAIFNHYVPWSTCTFALHEISLEARKAWLTERRAVHPVVVAETDGEVVAWGSLEPFRPRAAYAATAEVSVYVDPSEHGRGLGRAIVRRLCARARAQDLRTLIAVVCTEQAASLKAFEREGFTRAALLREVGEKLGRYLDVAFLERRVGEAPAESSGALR